jgi:hypothetical protein
VIVFDQTTAAVLRAWRKAQMEQPFASGAA